MNYEQMEDDFMEWEVKHGKEEAIPIHPSNLVVTALYEGDPVRIKQLIERGGVLE